MQPIINFALRPFWFVAYIIKELAMLINLVNINSTPVFSNLFEDEYIPVPLWTKNEYSPVSFT